jgi:hypothetical protein
VGLNEVQAAKLIGATRQALVQRKKRGQVTTLQDGTFDPETLQREWIANASPTHVERGKLGGGKQGKPTNGNGHGGADDVGKSYLAARAANESLSARINEIKLKQLTKELVSATEVRLAAFTLSRRARDQLLTIPDRLAAQVSGLTDPAEIHKLMFEEIYRVCQELSKPVIEDE